MFPSLGALDWCTFLVPRGPRLAVGIPVFSVPVSVTFLSVIATAVATTVSPRTVRAVVTMSILVFIPVPSARLF